MRGQKPRPGPAASRRVLAGRECGRAPGNSWGERSESAVAVAIMGDFEASKLRASAMQFVSASGIYLISCSYTMLAGNRKTKKQLAVLHKRTLRLGPGRLALQVDRRR